MVLIPKMSSSGVQMVALYEAKYSGAHIFHLDASVNTRLYFGATQDDATRYRFKKRYRVAAGSAQPIRDYLRPPRLPSLPRFFHPSRLFSIARSLLPHDSAMEIATGIARVGHSLDPLKSTHPPPQTQLTATQLTTHPALNSTHLHQSNHQSKFLDPRTGKTPFSKPFLYIYLPIILLISSLEKFHIRCPSRSSVHLLWISECVCE